ncbi:heme exporter protein CcmD [Acerihabitans sp. TG2]|uniref:heme exporter protein CcmD n=1 Tax=Acerihabitans sp. TG2 TaxID=3096008 RepID=UPI002B224237|nr:heme exporter protein CcmD [Acerihabitans sp. TG2]MEA9389099.1 heme exporter protein CcmD [Acerihabitans sp. TG2]
MTPAFNSWSAFFAMGGYAFYVWLTVSVSLLSLLGLVIHTHWHRRQLLEAIRRQQTRTLRMRRGRLNTTVDANPPVAHTADGNAPDEKGSALNTPGKIAGEDVL